MRSFEDNELVRINNLSLTQQDFAGQNGSLARVISQTNDGYDDAYMLELLAPRPQDRKGANSFTKKYIEKL